MEKHSTLGPFIQRSRLDIGLTQTEFAESVDMSQRWVSDLERGVIKTVKPRLLHRVAEVLRVNPEDIVIAGNLSTTSAGAKAIAESTPEYDKDLPPHLRASFLRVGELSPTAQKKLETFLDDLFLLEDFQNTKNSRSAK
ncbi:MAG: helix-turn-helix domain-containing protein [Thermomicrobiales bacterium]